MLVVGFFRLHLFKSLNTLLIRCIICKILTVHNIRSISGKKESFCRFDETRQLNFTVFAIPVEYRKRGQVMFDIKKNTCKK